MNALQVFQNNQFGEIRAMVKDGEPWFIAKDVCDILEVLNSREAVNRLDDDEKDTVILNDGTPGNPNYAVINESGLYSLILGSRKPEARRFKKWVTSDVLPSIRKTGMYAVSGFPVPQTYPEALRLAADLAEQNQILKPKADQHDLFLTGENCQTMNEVAKSLDIGRNKLFEYLRDKKVLMGNNVPYQNYLDRGYFKVIEKPIAMGGSNFNKTQTLVTSKGVEYIAKLLMADRPMIQEELSISYDGTL